LATKTLGIEIADLVHISVVSIHGECSRTMPGRFPDRNALASKSTASSTSPLFRLVVSPSARSANSGQASLRVHPPEAGKLRRTACAERSRTMPGRFPPPQSGRRTVSCPFHALSEQGVFWPVLASFSAICRPSAVGRASTGRPHFSSPNGLLGFSFSVSMRLAQIRPIQRKQGNCWLRRGWLSSSQTGTPGVGGGPESGKKGLKSDDTWC